VAWCLVKQRHYLYLLPSCIFKINEHRKMPAPFTGYNATRSPAKSRFDSLRGLRIFLFDVSSKPALGPTQLPVQWVPEASFSRVKRPESETDHSHLVPRLMRGAVPPLSNTHTHTHTHTQILNSESLTHLHFSRALMLLFSHHILWQSVGPFSQQGQTAAHSALTQNLWRS